MAFYATFEKKRRVKFAYFLSPFPGYYGWIFLPTLLILPMYFLSDIASYLGTNPQIGSGIAYAAHIGGALFGASLGLVLRSFRQSLWVRWISQH
jgi:membrane associated rhomboid family serine protease